MAITGNDFLLTPTKNFPYVMRPLNNITPFTCEDGTTYLEILTYLAKYIKDMGPDVDEKLKHLFDEFQKGITNAENTIIKEREEWQKLFDEFMANIVVQLEGLNDQAVANLVSNESSSLSVELNLNFANKETQETVEAGRLSPAGLSSLIESIAVTKDDLFFNVKDYGAIGDGVVDDTLSIRKTIEKANLSGGTVFFPAGNYWLSRDNALSFLVSGAGNFPNYMFRVKDNVSIIGSGATITDDTEYSNRRITFFLDGSNITINGLKFNNIFQVSGNLRPTNIPIGMGDGFDSTVIREYENINIVNCEFRNSWHPTKTSFIRPDGVAKLKNYTIKNCYSEGNLLTESSGGFNFISKPRGRINNAIVSNNSCHSVSASAAIGYYGVQDGVISNNICNKSGLTGAGIQLENGSDNITISNNVLADHYNGVWVDDSTNVNVSSNAIRNTGVSASYKGIRITYQGFDENPHIRVTGISVNSNILTNCYITAELFSSLIPGGTASIGSISIMGNKVQLDGVTNLMGIRLSTAVALMVINNEIIGASETSIRLTPNTNQIIVIDGNITRKVGSEESIGLNITTMSGIAPTVSNNHFMNGLPTNLRPVSSRVGNVLVISGSGSPQNTITAVPGSIYLRNDATLAAETFYVKSGVGQVGWVAK